MHCELTGIRVVPGAAVGCMVSVIMSHVVGHESAFA